MKEMLPYSLIGLIVCFTLALITYGAISLEGPSGASYSPYVYQIKETYNPVYVSTATLIEIDEIMARLSEINRIGIEEERQTQIADAPIRIEQERRLTEANALNIKKVQENRNRIVEIENRAKEIDTLIAQKTEGKKADDEILAKVQDNVQAKIKKGLPTGFNQTDELFYAPVIKRSSEADASIAILQGEKDKLNKEISTLK